MHKEENFMLWKKLIFTKCIVLEDYSGAIFQTHAMQQIALKAHEKIAPCSLSLNQNYTGCPSPFNWILSRNHTKNPINSGYFFPDTLYVSVYQRKLFI